MNRKAVIMTALDFSRLDQDFIETAVFAAFCADSTIAGQRREETPEIFYHGIYDRLCFWTDDRQLTYITPDTPVQVVFKSLESTIERYQKAQDKIKQLVETNPAAFQG